MDGATCDRCNAPLLVRSDVRYVVTIEVKCAYDPMEITDDDLRQDHASEMRKLLQQMEGLSEQEAQDQVYRKFTFDLCPKCQREFIRAPLWGSPG